MFLWSVAYGQVCADEDTVRSNAASLITATTARINGTVAHFTSAPTSLQLRYVRVGQTDTATASSAPTTALRNLTGLQPNTQYVYYYKTICGSGTRSQNIGAYTFTTLASTIVYATERSTQFRPYALIDSVLQFGATDTTLNRAQNLPSIAYKSSNNTFYGYYPSCTCWRALAIDSSGIIGLLDGKVDSVTVSGDSLFYWKVGVSYGYILPSLANTWQTDGNAGIDTSTQFLGTTDNVDLVIKTNNTRQLTVNVNGAIGIGSTPDYGTSGYLLKTNGSGSAPAWVNSNGLFWKITGNSGTTPGTNFIGTTDGQDLVIKVNSTEISRYLNSSASVEFGEPSTNISSGIFSLTSGNTNTASGDNSVSFGQQNLSSGIHSFSAGLSNTSSGEQSFSAGAENIASDYTSIAMGHKSTASGNGAVAIGDTTHATGINSAAFGVQTYARHYGGFVIGVNNDSTAAASSSTFNTSNRVFQIGIGPSAGTRVNAMTVLFNGNVGIGTLTPTKTLEVNGTILGRWVPRVGSTTSSATPTINTDNVDVYKLTAQAADITSFTSNLSGTPVDGDILEIQITGTASRAITWGSSFVSTTVTLPTTTSGTATLTVIVQYYTTSSYGNNKWHCTNYY